ncbi:MAG: hypothetical protein NC489_24985 [Ruminococcus flavefaciens]|nr:hypothetical protein [Ruminococcus flavefaciens]
MAYIANKPIRFDRDYHIGEIIPETAIDLMMARKLTDMGKIICVTLPTEGGAEATPDSAGQPTDGAESTDGINTQEAAENAPEGQNEATEGGTEADAEGAEADSTAEATPDSAGQPTDGAETGNGTAEGAQEFKCDVCGRVFGSANALSAHSRVHKQ